jgi:hypothetical protein
VLSVMLFKAAYLHEEAAISYLKKYGRGGTGDLEKTQAARGLSAAGELGLSNTPTHLNLVHIDDLSCTNTSNFIRLEEAETSQLSRLFIPTLSQQTPKLYPFQRRCSEALTPNNAMPTNSIQYRPR